ncbi:MAG TPA: LuxR C-terminal-related transcriptional regulator [Streptosporangiaceae bacterium]
MVLLGRTEEQLVVDRLLADARSGRSGTLVIRGEPGIGKSALLEYAAANATGMRILRSSGAETEAELPFSGLHMLLCPVLATISALPSPQAAALRRAFGIDAGGTDDQYLVGLAVLSLLSELAETAPLLCLIDDASWLDRASAVALSFAARRLESEGVVLLCAARDARGSSYGPALPELRLTGLDQADAARLVDERAARLPPGLRARVLTEARGNPLALIELAAHAGTAPADGPEPLPATSDMFAAALGRLGVSARTMLLLAAAEPAGDLALIVRAARAMGADPYEVDRAEQAGLVMLTTNRLEFRHPLIRSAAYHGASLADRRAAHRALADALGPCRADFRDHRAWHIAAATAGMDERAAATMEDAARRSLERGGYVAAAAAYERAAALTPGRQQRARRVLAAVGAANDGGDLDRAIRLAERLDQLSGDDVLRARLALVRAQMPTADRADHIAGLIASAERIRFSDPDLTITMLTQAASLAWTHHNKQLARTAANLLRELPGVRDERAYPFAAAVAQQALLLAGDRDDQPGISDFLKVIQARPGDAKPMERIIASWIAFSNGDLEATAKISADLVADCRSDGMVGWLAGALEGLAVAQFMVGDWNSARASATEGFRLALDTGQGLRVSLFARLLAWFSAHTGDEDGFRSWVEQAPADVAGVQGWYLAGCVQLELANGRFEPALGHAEELAASLGLSTVFMYQPDLVEAAVRTGHDERAREQASRFAAWAEQSGFQWARAIAHRCLALVTGQEAHFAEAIGLHEGAGCPFELARTRLLYGEWLRRHRRRADARTQLAVACEIFVGLGADGYANRAGAELTATGASPERHGRRPDPLSRLTPQEAQVVRLAAEGLSNRDIAARLFLSPRTVGHYLYRAYPKLGVASRAELRVKTSNDD